MMHQRFSNQAVGALGVLAASLFLACGSGHEATFPLRQAERPGPKLNKPVNLGPDSTVIVLSDLTPLGVAVDSVRDERGQSLAVSMDETWGATVTVLQQPERGMGFLQVWSEGEHWEIPTYRTSSERVTFRFEGESGSNVFAMGGFNGWSRTGFPLNEIGAGEYIGEWTLPAGKHPYQFVVNGVEMPDPENPEQVPNGFGGFNSLMTVGAPDAPAVKLTAEWSVPDEFRREVVLTAAPGVEVWGYWNDFCYDRKTMDSTGQVRMGVPAAAFEMERSDLRFWAATDRQHSDVIRLPLSYGELVTRPEQLARNEPAGMIMYFMMVDRFVNGNPENDRPVEDPGIRPEANHFGGDLAGILQAQAEGYFDSLGMNTVWISPIVTNPEGAWGYWQDPQTEVTSKFSGYHGYWPIRSREVDDRFGTIEELQTLAAELHADRKNLILDYVANHIHQEHPLYQEHPDWVTELYLPDGRLNTQLWDEQRLTTWFDTFMPSLDFSRPEVVEALTDSALWWVTETDIDGFRHDATKHIPLAFWRTMTGKIRGTGKELFQIGETYGDPQLINSYINRGMLDAQFDFNLYDVAVTAFSQAEAPFQPLIEIAEQSIAVYGADHLMGNITGNQDRARFTSYAEGTIDLSEDSKFAGWTREIRHKGTDGYKRMQMLQSFILAMPGIPCIYYGDEIADVGGNDPDNRRMLRREGLNPDELATRNHLSAFAHLRGSRMSMLYGTTEIYEIEPGVLRIDRKYPGEKTSVIINKSERAIVLPLQNDESLLAGKGLSADGTVQVPSMSVVALGTQSSVGASSSNIR